MVSFRASITIFVSGGGVENKIDLELYLQYGWWNKTSFLICLISK